MRKAESWYIAQVFTVDGEEPQRHELDTHFKFVVRLMRQRKWITLLFDTAAMEFKSEVDVNRLYCIAGDEADDIFDAIQTHCEEQKLAEQLQSGGL